jgi:peptide deformylase
MAKLTVLVAPNKILQTVSAPVDQLNSQIKTLINDMMETMEAEDGIGLAAPQVGVSKRILVMNVPNNVSAHGEIIENVNSEPCVFKIVNPEIVWKSDTKIISREGCLSVPSQYAEVTRASEIKIKYLDENGENCETHFYNLQAVCVQHEIDHLDGKLFVDYLSSFKKSFLIGKGKKFAERYRKNVS